MTARARQTLKTRPDDFPTWPSGDCRIVAQLKEPLSGLRKRVRKSFPSTDVSKIRQADAEDGLGEYQGFHAIDPDLGMIAFTSYVHAPAKTTNVIVDAGKPPAAAVGRLQGLLHFEPADVDWTHPEFQWKRSASGYSSHRPRSAYVPIEWSSLVELVSEKVGVNSSAAEQLLWKRLRAGPADALSSKFIVGEIANRPVVNVGHPRHGKFLQVRGSLSLKGTKTVGGRTRTPKYKYVLRGVERLVRLNFPGVGKFLVAVPASGERHQRGLYNRSSIEKFNW